MLRRLIAFILCFAYINLLAGCSYQKERFLTDEIRKQPPYQTIVDAVLVTGEQIVFSKQGGRYDPARREIVGRTADGRKASVSIDAVLYVHVKQINVSKSLLIGFAAFVIVGGVVLLFALLLKESCPFVYSYDGDKYVFDAEPLGGAICKTLARSDLSRMEYLKEVDGQYKLLVRNEVEETQYIDQMNLLALDHPRGTEVIADSSGQLWAVQATRGPITARDENGNDLSKFFAGRDGIAWQSHLPTVSRDSSDLLRHELTLTFDRGESDSIYLIVNAGTALWGSHMIREMLSLRGDGLDRWYDGVNQHGKDLFDLIHFTYREETYVLNLQVYRDGGWQPANWIAGGGPLIVEDKLICLDATGTDGDSIRLRLTPPPGFWSIDYIGVVENPPVKCAPVELPLIRANGLERSNLTGELRVVDGTYVEMPRVDDSFELSFEAPAATPGLDRTLFLRTTGYYELHIDKSRPEQTEFIQTALATPGTIAKYAMAEYRKYAREKTGTGRD